MCTYNTCNFLNDFFGATMTILLHTNGRKLIYGIHIPCFVLLVFPHTHIFANCQIYSCMWNFWAIQKTNSYSNFLLDLKWSKPTLRNTKKLVTVLNDKVNTQLWHVLLIMVIHDRLLFLWGEPHMTYWVCFCKSSLHRCQYAIVWTVRHSSCF